MQLSEPRQPSGAGPWKVTMGQLADVREANRALGQLGRGRLWMAAMDLFSSLQMVRLGDTISFNTMISASTRALQWQTAVLFFSGMLAAEVSTDAISYNSTISACERGSRWQAALQLLAGMPRSRKRPDDITYNSTISALRAAGEWELAVTLLSSMPLARICSDLISFSAAIGACETAGQWQVASQLFADLAAASIRADEICLSTAMSACAKAGSWQAALCLLWSISGSALETDEISFSTAISACARGAVWRQALEILEAMEREQVRMNGICFNAALNACEKCGQWQVALQGLQTFSRFAVLPDAISTSAAMSACAKKGQWRTALQLLVASWARLPLDDICFNAAISACATAGQWQMASLLLEAMPRAAVRADAISFSAAISACEGEGQWSRALLLLASMRSVRVKANEIGFNAAISVCAKGTQWRMSLQLPYVMSIMQVTADEITFSAAISSCEKPGFWQRAIGLLAVSAGANEIAFGAAIGTFQQDMRTNLRNVVLPTGFYGLPLSVWATTRLHAVFAILFVIPTAAFWGSWYRRLKGLEASELDCYRRTLLEPRDWFQLWRLNCRLASMTALATKSSDFDNEDKWNFIKGCLANKLPTTPALPSPKTLVAKVGRQGDAILYLYVFVFFSGPLCCVAAWTCAMIVPECVSPWQLSPGPAAGRGSFHALALLLLVLCLQRRRALFRNVPKGCPWRRMQGPFLTPKKVDPDLEASPVAPKRANLTKRPKVRLGLQVCNKFEVLASPVATPTPSPRAARPGERSLPEAGTDAPDAPGDWTTVHYRSRKKDSTATPAAASLAPPLEAPSNDNGDAIDLYYAQKDAFVRSWTRESKQARSVKQKKRVDYQVAKRRLQSEQDRSAREDAESSE
eukprot:s546_g7.t3